MDLVGWRGEFSVIWTFDCIFWNLLLANFVVVCVGCLLVWGLFLLCFAVCGWVVWFGC